MIHPGCGGSGYKAGKTQAGTQRYKCRLCGKRFSENSKIGRPLLGDRPMTSTERCQKYRKKTRYKD